MILFKLKESHVQAMGFNTVDTFEPTDVEILKILTL